MFFGLRREAAASICVKQHGLGISHRSFGGMQFYEFTIEKVRDIVKQAGYCCLISKNRIARNVAFTITPHKVPGFFKANLNDYDNISPLLKSKAFVPDPYANSMDPWNSINSFRVMVADALNQALSEVVGKYDIADFPIVEIGTGTGYKLNNPLTSKIIFTQADHQECQALGEFSSVPFFHVDIDGIYNCLKGESKKVHLFFAINVMDAIPQPARKTALSQLAQLQNEGDRLLIILDSQPFLNVLLTELETSHPQHRAIPILSLTGEYEKSSIIMIPNHVISEHPKLDYFWNLSTDDLLEKVEEEAGILNNKQRPLIQEYLHELHRKHKFKVIILEDYYSGNMQKELKEAGYTAEIYYHASFTQTQRENPSITDDIVYKPVTDGYNVRQWALADHRLHKQLAEKGLRLPSHITQEFVDNLRKTNQYLIGAELLIIDAKKI